MANYEIDDRAAPRDTRPLLVKGKRYHSKTSTVCTTCAHAGRNMYVKQKLDHDWMLECPVCESYLPMKASSVVEIE